MGQELGSIAVRTEHAEVVQHGEKLILPSGMSPDAAIDILLRKMKYDDEEVSVLEEYDVFPWDGAHALQRVLEQRFGWANAVPTQGFFGPQPPKTIMVEVGYQEKLNVIWGKFSLPGIQGWLHTGVKTTNSGRLMFVLQGQVKRKHEGFARSIMEDVRQFLRENSLYRGKAIRMRFRDDEGKAFEMPDIKFLDTQSVREDQLILSDHLHDSVETNLYTPIRRVRELRANGIPVKRGVLLGGTYGTGKTLAAAVASKIAVEQGVMYLAVDRADELAMAIEFARQYEDPACVLFCEDIDRVVSGERDTDMDDLLNVIDGIDSKSSNLIVVLTTNDLDSLNPAILRPGRLDAVIEVTPPDAKATERLLRYYGEDNISEGEDLSEVAEVLEGHIPAVIEEVVKKAKLAQLRRLPQGHLVEGLSVEALLESARTMHGQLDLLQRRIENPAKVDPSFKEMIEGAVANSIDGQLVKAVKSAVSQLQK